MARCAVLEQHAWKDCRADFSTLVVRRGFINRNQRYQHRPSGFGLALRCLRKITGVCVSEPVGAEQAHANRVEHYEIAAYGSARAFAQMLGMDRAVALLEETLKEEKAADEKLTKIAESIVNDQARQFVYR